MIAFFHEIMTLLFDAFLADGKVRDDHPAWTKIQIEILGATNLHRRFLHLAMRRTEVPRDVFVALLGADPDLSQTLRRETLPPDAHRPVPLDVFVLVQAIPGVEARPGEQLRKIDAVACWPLANSAAVAGSMRDTLHANPWRTSFNLEFFDPVAHNTLIAGQVLFCDFYY